MWFSLCMLLHSSISALSSASNCFQLPTFSWSARTQQPVYHDLILERSPLPATEVTQCPSYLGEQTTQSLFRSSQLWCFEPCVPKTVEAHVLPYSLPASAESSFYLPTPKRLILFHNKKTPNKQTTYFPLALGILAWTWDPFTGKRPSWLAAPWLWILHLWPCTLPRKRHGGCLWKWWPSDCETQSAGTVGVL